MPGRSVVNGSEVGVPGLIQVRSVSGREIEGLDVLESPIP